MTDQGQASGPASISKVASCFPIAPTSVSAITLTIFSLLTKQPSPADPCSGCLLREREFLGPHAF